jgi:RecA-family ATPase
MASLDLTKILTEPEVTPPWLVDNFLCEGTVVILAGEPGVGKSVLSYTLSLSIASNLPFLGRSTSTGHVLYFDEENSLPDTKQYLKWAWRGLGSPDLKPLSQNLHIEHFSLAGLTSRTPPMTALAARIAPRLIVVDTATPVCSILDENDNGEASRAIKGLRAVKEAAGPQATMLVLKHMKTGHPDEPGQERTIRGAKAWLGEVDGVLFHLAQRGRPRKDGLKNTRVTPSKIRAFGLR